MNDQPGSAPTPDKSYTIPSAARLAGITLQVAGLARALDFYHALIGLAILDREGPRADLGAGSDPFVRLEELPGAAPQPPNTTGLYHIAIRFPDRRSLALKIAQIALRQIPLGQGDHWVSEAFYLTDPDGNGLELYHDRPREQWKYAGSQIKMGTDPVDIEGFFAELGDTDPSRAGPAAPPETRLGHIHLRVADLDASQRFYCDLLGFDLQASLPGALFVSAGGYHHHIGMNTWQSRGGRPPQKPSSGMREFTIALPDASELEHLAARLESAGLPLERSLGAVVVYDPASIRVRFVVG